MNNVCVVPVPAPSKAVVLLSVLVWQLSDLLPFVFSWAVVNSAVKSIGVGVCLAAFMSVAGSTTTTNSSVDGSSNDVVVRLGAIISALFRWFFVFGVAWLVCYQVQAYRLYY